MKQKTKEKEGNPRDLNACTTTTGAFYPCPASPSATLPDTIENQQGVITNMIFC